MLVFKIQNGLFSGQFSSLTYEYNQKRHFIRARPEGRFYENMVCIVLITGSELEIIKQYLTARESTYIELILRKITSVQG